MQNDSLAIVFDWLTMPNQELEIVGRGCLATSGAVGVTVGDQLVDQALTLDDLTAVKAAVEFQMKNN